MKKILSILLALTLILGVSAGCSNEFPPNGTEPGSNSSIEGTTDNGAKTATQLLWM